MTTVFLDKKTTFRYYILIGSTFLLSISVFMEFRFMNLKLYPLACSILMAIRYSATPFLIALILITLSKRFHWIIFLPAIVLTVLDIISIFTGIVFEVSSDNTLIRGPLAFLPYIIAGLYCLALIAILIRRSNKRLMEIVPIVFLSLTLASGVILPFFLGKDFASIFCTTIIIALFTYYEFSTLSLTKKDPLTGLLNRQAYYADSAHDKSSITVLVSVDMNGLKTINDKEGHAAGDKAIISLALCLNKSLRRWQACYRVGGDEFLILCRKSSEEDARELVKRIRGNVSLTPYSCSIGYSYSPGGTKPIDDMIKESDAMMYRDKEKFYQETGKERRGR